MMARWVLNNVPVPVLALIAVVLTIGVVVLAVWLIRRAVPATREGFHAEISAPMLGVVAALFGLLLAFGGLPVEIAALILFSSVVIVGYAVLVGSPNFWFHVLGPAAIAVVVAFSLLVLFDLSYPFSGDVALDPQPFESGALAPSFLTQR
jgi:hypothetical protein